MLCSPHAPCRAAVFRFGFRAAADSCIASSTTRALRADNLSTALLSRRPASAWEKSTLLGARSPGRNTTTSPTLPGFLRGPSPSTCLDDPQPMDAPRAAHLQESPVIEQHQELGGTSTIQRANRKIFTIESFSDKTGGRRNSDS